MKSRYWQGWLLLRAVTGNEFHASPHISGGLLVAFGFPWVLEGSSQLLPSSLYSILPVCESLTNLSLLH